MSVNAQKVIIQLWTFLANIEIPEVYSVCNIFSNNLACKKCFIYNYNYVCSEENI